MLLAVSAALLAVVPSAAFGGASHVTVNSQTYTDSTGEDANAPDITTIAISNNDAGLITFKVNISNRPALTSDMSIQIFLDTDLKSTTGDPQFAGADYVLELDPGSIALFQWNGSDYVGASSQASVTFAYDATGATLRVSANDLNKTKGFNFAAFAVSGIATDANGNPDFTNVHFDAAPDPGHGLFNYKVIQKVTLSVVAFTTTPKPAKSGKNFTAGLAVNESDTSGPVTSGTVTCNATVGLKHITLTGKSLKNGIAVCLWHLARTAKGKTLRGTITLTVQGVKVTRNFSARIS